MVLSLCEIEDFRWDKPGWFKEWERGRCSKIGMLTQTDQSINFRATNFSSQDARCSAAPSVVPTHRLHYWLPKSPGCGTSVPDQCLYESGRFLWSHAHTVEDSWEGSQAKSLLPWTESHDHSGTPANEVGREGQENLRQCGISTWNLYSFTSLGLQSLKYSLPCCTS